MSRFRTAVAVLMGAIALSFSTQTMGAITLVRDGKPTSVIVTSDRPTPVQQLAAEQLQYHLGVMTGAQLPIIAEKDLGSSDAARIYVGQSRRLSELGIDTTTLPAETLIVRTVADGLVLAGDDTGSGEHESFFTTGPDPDIPPETADDADAADDGSVLRRGTLYAVYDFLHDELGCRWLWPGPTGEVIPKRATITLGELDVQETPTLFMRHFRTGYHGWTWERVNRHVPRYLRARVGKHFDPMHQQEELWLARLKMGHSDRPEYGHAFTDWHEKYFDTHPDIFALQADGTRGLPNETYPASFVKLCVSSDKLIDLIIARFEQRRRANPDHRWLNACENDGSLGFCRCADCRALDVTLNSETRAELAARGWSDEQIEREFTAGENGLPNSLSNRYFHFYNKLARRLAEVAPDAYVITYAYSKYRFAPVGMQVEPNILVGLIGFNGYPMTEAERAAEISNVQAWKRSGVEKMFFRPNSFIFSPAWGIPWDDSEAMARDLKMLIDAGMVATDFDRMTGHWATAAPMYYVMARMHWDHHATAAELREEFMQAFGPAAEPIREYFDLWQRVFHEAHHRPDIETIARRADPLGGRLGRRKAAPMLISESDLQRARQLLAEARERVEQQGDPDLLKPIEVLELGLRHGELMLDGARFAIERKYDQPRRFESHWPTVTQIHAIREKLADRGAMNIFFMIGWGLQIHDPYATRVYYDFVARPYKPVMTPARKDWKFVPDPDGVGETQGWFERSLDESMALHPREYPAYRHLFYSTWDYFGPVTAWKRETGRQAVVNGWYQIEFALSEQDLQPGHVLYVPYIEGSAKIWVNDQLVREVSEQAGRSDEAIVLNPSEAGIEADKPFRLTIRVHRPDASGGLIGPVYLAAPTQQ